MIRFIALGGFLGSGKTTTLIAAAKRLEAGGRAVAVVTNDQGTELIDTQLVRSHLDAVGEVTGGCFCCRFDDLMDTMGRLLDGGTVDTVLAEAVGSCTDLQATVIRPLLSYYGTRFAPAPLTVVLDPHRHHQLGTALPLHDQRSDLAYLYAHQLAEAEIIAVNKIDLLSGGERRGLLESLAQRYPDATVLAYSARTGEGLEDLIAACDRVASPGPSVDIDYDRYAAAEAGLAWFNQSYSISAGDLAFSPEEWARTALTHLAREAGDRRWTVGHVKVSVQTPGGLTKASITGASAAPVMDETVAGSALTGVATVNARIACEPETMESAVSAAIAAADTGTGVTTRPTEVRAAFKPGYPRPVHRIVD